MAASDEILILSAARTPIGNLNGALSSLPAHKLGSIVIGEALKRGGVEASEVSELIMGQILTAGENLVLSQLIYRILQMHLSLFGIFVRSAVMALPPGLFSV